MKYLLDTNICIYLINRKPVQVIARMIKIPAEDIGISAVTLAELEYGVEKSDHPDRNRVALMETLVPIQILPFDHQAAREYGMIRAPLERKGTVIGAMDLMIAAHAKALGVILVTNNEKEFKRVSGLMLENWAA
ncbi:MAG: type II toxin-antitoxin system VapC family toxin [Planctomycetota bacterium]